MASSFGPKSYRASFCPLFTLETCYHKYFFNCAYLTCINYFFKCLKLITKIFGSWLALKYGFRNVITFAIICDSLLTLFSPIAARFSYISLIAVRFIIGLAHVN